MIRSPSSTRRAAQRSFTASACTTNACAAPTLTQGSLWSRGTTPRRASATASTRWGARGRRPTMRAPSPGGTTGFPIPSSPATGCIGCAEQNFWDHGSFYSRITNIPQFGTNTTAETVGVAAVAGIGAGGGDARGPSVPPCTSSTATARTATAPRKPRPHRLKKLIPTIPPLLKGTDHGLRIHNAGIHR